MFLVFSSKIEALGRYALSKYSFESDGRISWSGLVCSEKKPKLLKCNKNSLFVEL